MEKDSPELLRSLVQSVRRHGLLQPIIVRPIVSSSYRHSQERRDRPSHARYEIICGHRRYSACRELGLTFIPAVVTNLDDRQALEVALVENLQRENLNPIEEAEAFKKYVTSYGRGSMTALAGKIGKSEEYVSHKMLLLGLPKEILDMISRRLLKPAQATELIWLKDSPSQINMAKHILTQKMSFRQTRNAVKLVKERGLSVSEAAKKVSDEAERRRENLHELREGEYPSNDNEMSDPWQDYPTLESENSHDDLRTVKHAALVIRTCLSGLDAIIDDADNERIRNLLLSERREIHGSLDRMIRAKVFMLKELR
jgi:ParB/RepB/Spo0J family partition protein